MPNDAAVTPRLNADQRLEARIDTLEIRLTEQQAVIDDLNKVALDQWKEISDLRRLVERLEGQLADVTSGPGVAPQDEPPPPHY
jgi:SlyX protein